MTFKFERCGLFAALALTALGLLADCSGGTPTLTPSTPSSSGTVGAHTKGSAHFIIKIPSRKSRRDATKPKYISASTQSMTVAVQGSATQTFNLTPLSSSCSQNAVTSITTCKEAMSIPSGQQTLTVTLYDQQNGQGDQLATATTSVDIAATGFTTIPITLDGVVATVKVLVNGESTVGVPAGIPTSFPVIVNAYDADANLIISPGNYSSPITLTNSDQSGVTSFTPPAAPNGKHRANARSGNGRIVATRPAQRHVSKPMDTTTVNAPSAALTLYYNGGSFTTATITPSVNGNAQSSGAVTLSESSITEFPVPTASSNPWMIATGPDGALWFTEYLGNNIGRISTSGAIAEYSLPSAKSRPQGITTGPDGAIWFTESVGGVLPSLATGEIGRITTNGIIAEYDTPTIHSGPSSIVAGPDGALWFTEAGSDSIGRITTVGTITEYTYSADNGQPYTITTGSDGALWFFSNRGEVGRITTDGSSITFFPAVPGSSGDSSSVYGITEGVDDALWFAGGGTLGNNIGQIPIDAAGGTQPTEYPIPTTNSEPADITAGPGGALWFAENNGNNIGRITTGGTISEFPIPTSGSSPLGITMGPDGAIWFTESNGNKIGRLP